MAVVSDRYKYIFLAEPHTASRSITNALIEQHGANEIAHHHITRAHLISREGINLRRQKYTFFSVVRHPFDLLLTMYYVSKRHKPYLEWLHERLEHGLKYVHDSKVLPADYYLHYERLDLELNNLMEKLKAPHLELLRMGITKDKPANYMDAYGPEEIDFVIRQAGIEKHYVL